MHFVLYSHFIVGVDDHIDPRSEVIYQDFLNGKADKFQQKIRF